jgi:SAM-dependent methyltransferase
MPSTATSLTPARPPRAARLCVFYNRLFAFRVRQDRLIQAKIEAGKRRVTDVREDDLQYAELEYHKAANLLRKFGSPSLEGKRILDFGCRFGGSSLWYAEQGASSVVGVDVSEYMLEIAREFVERTLQQRAPEPPQRHPPVEFRLGSAERIPAEEGSIDLILSEDVVEHLADPGHILGEWRRVLAPGGRVLISFGPLWYHPHGIHLWEVFHAPWTHVLFSLRTCLWAKCLMKSEEPHPELWQGSPDALARRWFDLGRMTLRRFERLTRDSGLRTIKYAVHPVWGLKPMLWVPGLRELFASQVECVLEK